LWYGFAFETCAAFCEVLSDAGEEIRRDGILEDAGYPLALASAEFEKDRRLPEITFALANRLGIGHVQGLFLSKTEPRGVAPPFPSLPSAMRTDQISEWTAHRMLSAE